jgi:hypothetical protein
MVKISHIKSNTNNPIVNNPFFFDTAIIDKKFIEGYCQAIYSIRCKLSSMDTEPLEVRLYTEFLIDELNDIIKKNNISL